MRAYTAPSEGAFNEGGKKLAVLGLGLLGFCLALLVAAAIAPPAGAAAQTRVTLRPASGPAGTVASLEGRGFGASGRVVVRLGRRTLAGARTGSGSFETSFRIPSGRGLLKINSSDGRRRVVNLFRLSRLSQAGQSGEVASRAGERLRWMSGRGAGAGGIDLEGAGFPARRPIHVSLGKVALRRGRTDRRGRFSTRLVVPSLVAGRYSVGARAARASLAFDFSVPPTAAPSTLLEPPGWPTPWVPAAPAPTGEEPPPAPTPIDELPPKPPVPPPAPILTGTDPGSPANGSPKVEGTAQAGSTVRLYTSADCSGAPAATGTAADFSSPGLTVSVPSNSTTTFHATATDGTGNASPCSAGSITYVEDSTAPGSPILSDIDPSSPASDNSPRVKGTAEAGSTVRLYTSGNCSGTVAATGSAAELSFAGIQASVPSNSTTTFRATATDIAGNTSSCSGSISYTEDSTAPPAPTLTGTDPGSPANDNAPKVKGTAQTGSVVRLYTSADCSQSAAATGTAADFSSPGLTVSVPSNSTTTFRATATDIAGNVSSCSSSATTYVEAPHPQPSLPIRAAFYYPWFPEAWNQMGINPFTKYNPSLGFYRSDEQAVRHSHLRSLEYAGFDAGIYSWWGQGHRTDQRFAGMLAETNATDSPLKWALYHEREGNGTDPTVAQLESDLDYIRAQYTADPAYLKVGGKPVIFVYAGGPDACPMADRWKEANTGRGFYVVLKVFAGYRTCPSQPDSWHQYAPSSRADRQRGYSFAISPEFDLTGPEPERLARDLAAFEQAARDMVASAEPWQLVISFNEWGENTATESATEWASPSGQGQYLDVLAGL